MFLTLTDGTLKYFNNLKYLNSILIRDYMDLISSGEEDADLQQALQNYLDEWLSEIR